MIKRSGLVALGILCAVLTLGMSDEPVICQAGKATTQADNNVHAQADSVELPTLREAKRQAEILHEAIHSTLQNVHHQYYREDEGLPLPAATLTDVFEDLESEQKIKLRWLAVEGLAMNADHKPQNDFEHEAVKVLKSGKREHELVAGGVYRRVGAITLSNHCLKCHVPDRKSLENRTAGLIIAIPVAK